MSNLFVFISRYKEVLVILVTIRFSLFFLSLYLNNFSFVAIVNSWVHWDGPHYIDLARYWYQPTGEQGLFIVFYPLYPLLIKLLSYITSLDFNLASIIISVFFSLIASIALFELTLLDFSKNIALKSIWFLNIFPTAYFLQASYTESLFLALSILTIYFFKKGSFISSGIVGALSSATRINGLLILPVLLFEKKLSTKNLISLLLVPAGFLFYLFINYLTFKDFLYFTKPLENNWYKHFSLPWQSMQALISSVPSFGSGSFYLYFFEISAIVFILISGIFTYLYVRKSYGVYIFLNLFMFTSTSFILSTPRYSLILFPIFIALASIKNNIFQLLISLLFIALLIYFGIFYIQGKWAF